MSISKTMLVCFISVLFVFGVSCASDSASKKIEQTDSSSKDKETVKAENVSKEVAELSEQTVCPVMGGAINKELYVDQDGKRIYMCCTMCTEQIKDNFQAMVEKMAENGERPETL